MKSVKTIRAGILGAGSIAVKMARTMLAVSGVSLTAVASRDLQKAQSFIRALSIPQGEPIPKAYGSYEEMTKDPDLDLIYVCTPQSFHFSHTMLCLSNGKSVLCEKAFMLSVAQAKTLGKKDCFWEKPSGPASCPSPKRCARPLRMASSARPR